MSKKLVVNKREIPRGMILVSSRTNMVLISAEPTKTVPSLYKYWDNMYSEQDRFKTLFPEFEIFKVYLASVISTNPDNLTEIFSYFTDWWDNDNTDSGNSIFNDFDYEDYAAVVVKNFDSM